MIPRPDDDFGEVVYVGSEVYQQPTAQCPAPAIMVFPPLTLATPTAITGDSYTATLQVGTTTTTIVVVPTPKTRTVTVINFSNYYITSSQQPGEVITLLPSFEVPPVPVVVTGPDGRTTTRTVFPPPIGAPTGGTTSNPGNNTTDIGGPGWPWGTPTTKTPDPTQDQNELPPFTPPPLTDLPGETGPGETEAPEPTVTWPFGIIEPVTDKSKPTPKGGSRVSCRTWFFFVSIDTCGWLFSPANKMSRFASRGETSTSMRGTSYFPLERSDRKQMHPLQPFMNKADLANSSGPPPPSAFRLPTGWHFGCPGCLPPWPEMT
jgi:chitinase